jgi:3alpha(or 20beta)-hydroxysteroid dehydrogenase
MARSRSSPAVRGEWLARAGARVVLGDVLGDDGDELARRLAGDGLEVAYTQLDVTDPGQWVAAVELTTERFGHPNVLVNNAGTGGPSGVAECSDEEWDRVIAVNQSGVFYGMRAVIPGMRELGGGSIVNIASQWGHNGGERGYVAYVASKWAVRGLTRNAALTYGGDGIRVNSISPGMVDTAMLGTEEKTLRALPRTALGRVGQVEDISPAVVYLASDQSSYVTGIDILIEGGLEVS